MSVRRSLIWSYGSQVVTLLVSFGTSVAVARLLGPYELGIYALALAVSGALTAVLSFSTQAYVVREATIEPILLRSAFTVNGLISLVLAAGLLLVGLIQWHLGKDALATVFLVMAPGPLFSAFEFVPSALFTREMRYGVISAVAVLRTVISAGMTLSLVVAGAGPAGLAAGPVVAGLTCALVFSVLRRRELVWRPSLMRFRSIMVFGAQMMSINGVAQLAQRGSDIILAQFLGLAALGLYARASGLSTLIFLNVYGLATGVIFVKMSRDLRETGEMHDTFRRALRMITGVMWPLLIGIALLAKPLVLLVYGAKWLPAAMPLSLLMVAQFVVLGFGMNWELFVLREETARQTRIEFARAVIGTALFALGCLVGITAAAVGRIAEAVVGYLLYRPHIDRLAGTGPGEIGNIYRESFFLTVAAVAPAGAMMAWYDWRPEVPIGAIAGSIVLGVGLWAALLARRGHPIAEEVRTLLRRFPPRA